MIIAETFDSKSKTVSFEYVCTHPLVAVFEHRKHLLAGAIEQFWRAVAQPRLQMSAVSRRGQHAAACISQPCKELQTQPSCRAVRVQLSNK
jgi:hypothetical protein